MGNEKQINKNSFLLYDLNFVIFNRQAIKMNGPQITNCEPINFIGSKQFKETVSKLALYAV